MSLFKNKSFKIVCMVCGLLGATLLGFNNCGNKASFSSPYNESSMASADSANYLLGLLDEAKQIEAKLLQQGDIQAIAQANELRQFIDNIESLISSTGSNLAVDDRAVLDQRDYLVNSMAKGRELIIVFNFTSEIQRLDAEDQKLQSQISALDAKFANSLNDLEARIKSQIANITTDIQNQITQIKNDYSSSFEAFQSQVEFKFNQMNQRIDVLEQRVANIEASINAINVMMQQLQSEVDDVRTTTLSAIAAVKSSLEDLKASTQSQIAQLMQMNNDLNKKLIDQQNAFNAYINAQTQISSLQARMCKIDISTGLVASGENVCQTQEDVDNGQCCLTAEAVNCSMMFPEDTPVAEEARNQCSNVVVTMRNQAAFVKQLAENEAEQNNIINQLVNDVQNLNDQVSLIKDGLAKLQDAVSNIENRLASMDARLILLEFKAARSEGVATIQERSDLYLAWIARRAMDVRDRFCYANASTAYDKSDYESARHNWVYCQERLKWLTEAQELIQLAKAYGEAALSLNLDASCSVMINSKNAESLSVSELMNADIADQVINKCSTGPNKLMALLLSIVKLQNKVGPDFRTADYMSKKAKAGQYVYFGGLVSQAGMSAIAKFENVDPTSDDLKDTYYGRIERVFKNRYVETRLRVQGKFPEDPSKFSGSVAGLNLVYSEAEIKGAANPYLTRVKALEIESACGGHCGFNVVARNDARAIGERFSYPKDSEIKCPVIDDTVMVRSSDGKHYAYSLNYTRYQGATEVLLPRLMYGNNNHYAVAASDAHAERGEFLGCGYRVRHIVDRFGIPDALLRGRHLLRYGRPYAKSHGLPQCQRFQFTCNLWSGVDNKGEWIAPNPNANILSYLSGFDTNRVTNLCKVSGNSYVAKERELLPEEMAKIWVYSSSVDANNTQALRNSISSNTTQLTKDYWMLQDKAIAYGVANDNVSQTKPFYAGVGSMSEFFLRGLASLNQYAPVKVQQCYDPK
ncbi:MAG: hypothetical protein H6623_07490 [Bdellovibrionaceae bacterium]|nr:hypothetical protein [Pseudobdellovibrionaceae bacterium]